MTTTSRRLAVSPWRHKFDRAALAEAYARDGHDGYAIAFAVQLAEATHGRAQYAEERATLAEWRQLMLTETAPAILAELTAEAADV